MVIVLFTDRTEKIGRLVVSALTNVAAYPRNLRWGCDPSQYDHVFFLYGLVSSKGHECITRARKEKNLTCIQVPTYKVYSKKSPYASRRKYINDQVNRCLEKISSRTGD